MKIRRFYFAELHASQQFIVWLMLSFLNGQVMEPQLPLARYLEIMQSPNMKSCWILTISNTNLPVLLEWASKLPSRNNTTVMERWRDIERNQRNSNKFQAPSFVHFFSDVEKKVWWVLHSDGNVRLGKWRMVYLLEGSYRYLLSQKIELIKCKNCYCSNICTSC